MYVNFTNEVSNDETGYYRSEIHTPIHSYHCWTIQFGKVNVLHAINTQC